MDKKNSTHHEIMKLNVKKYFQHIKNVEWAKNNGLSIVDERLFEHQRKKSFFLEVVLALLIIVLTFIVIFQSEILSNQMRVCLEVVASAGDKVTAQGALDLCKAVTAGWWS